MVAAVPRCLTPGRRLRVALVAWLVMLGLDFLLNGALFARMYQGDGAFMLAPTEAFRRIPLGYLAFLILAIGVVELVYRLRVTRLADGVRLGLLIGAVLAATSGAKPSPPLPSEGHIATQSGSESGEFPREFAEWRKLAR